MDAKTKFDIKRLIKRMQTFKGRHTELITAYIPAGYDINGMISQLSQEVGTAANIKSAATRNNVTSALEKMIGFLRGIGRTPTNGIVVFTGNIAEREGQQDFQTFSFEPPIPLKIKMYRCDKQFITEPIEDMILDKECYGLVVLDQRDATIALLKGKVIIPLKTTHSEVPGKMRAGGQSAVRFASNRELAVTAHFKKIADYMKDEFLMLEGLKGIILGGPGTTVKNFINKDLLTGDVKKKVLGTKDLSYTGEFGLQELVDKAEDILAEEEVAKEKKIMAHFFYLLSTGATKVGYGEADTWRLLEMGAVDTLLISEKLPDEIIEKYEKKAEELGTVIQIISTDTREGEQLYRMGGYAAILRYSVHS